MENKAGKFFIEKTKYHNLSISDQMKGLPSPPLELEFDHLKSIIDLPKPESIKVKEVSIRMTIEKRQSIRQYSDSPLSLEELSYLLWCTQGVKQVFPGSATLRNVPSAGARHAFETFLLVNQVKQVNPGLYRFLALDHKLIEININLDIADRITAACLGQNFIKKCAATFIWTAVPHRMNWRYSERGYRYLFMDAGHVCQNLYLSAEAIDCGVCAIGAFSDDDLNRILKLEEENQFVIYLATVGKK